MAMTAVVDDKTLLRWLDERPDRLERYLDKHPDAVERLEALTALSPRLGERLDEAVAPAADFQARMVENLQALPSGKETATMLLDLLTLSIRTAKFVASPTRTSRRGGE
jgi:hypothetical protein